jgi:hypothetical protein
VVVLHFKCELANLKEKGAITDEEYEIKKKELI